MSKYCCNDKECGVRALMEILDSLFNDSGNSTSDCVGVVLAGITEVTEGRVRFPVVKEVTEGASVTDLISSINSRCSSKTRH